MGEYEEWIVFVLVDHDTLSLNELTSAITSMGARPNHGAVRRTCEELEGGGVVEIVGDPDSESYRIGELPALVRYHLTDLGPTDAATIEAEKSRLLPDVSRAEIEDALRTLLEDGDVFEVGDGQYDLAK